MRTRLFGIALSLLLLAGEVRAQGVVGPGVVYPYAGGGGGGSSTLTSGTTATSGCVAGGVLRSISNLVECGAGFVFDTNGRVGINAATPQKRLHVVGDSDGIRLEGTQDAPTGTRWYDISRTLSSGFLQFNGGESTYSGFDFQVNNGTTVLQIANNGATTITSRGGVPLTINNGASAVSPLVVQDNGVTYFSIADGGNGTFQGNLATGTFSVGSSALTVTASALSSGYATANTSTVAAPYTYYLNSTGTPAAGYGLGQKYQLHSSTTFAVDAGQFNVQWTDATHASRTSRAVLQTVNNAGSLADAFSVGGTTVASAGTIAVIANATTISGTTNIDTITAKNPGYIVTLIFQGVLTVNDASNLKLAGNFTTTADDTLTLICDGTNWHEIARSIN